MSSILSYVQAYQALGWHLVPLPAYAKAPTAPRWNEYENVIHPGDPWPPLAGGVGIAHAWSGTCALDVDDFKLAGAWLEEQGLSLGDLYADQRAVQIRSGRPGHAKLLYRLPALLGTSLPSQQVRVAGRCVLEFRCATRNGRTVQDVLPPSIHPDTRRPYQWGGDYTALPEIPYPLLSIWLTLLERHTPPEEAGGVVPTAALEEIESALDVLDPDCSMLEWIEIGMAIHSAHPDAGGLAVWDAWSARGTKYRPGEPETRWRSFHHRDGGVTLRTLFRRARDAGWRGWRPSAQTLFEAVAGKAVAGDPPERRATPAPPPSETHGVVEVVEDAEVVARMTQLVPRAPTYDALIQQAEDAAHLDDEAIRQLLTQAWSIGLDPLQEDRLLQVIMARSHYTAQSIRRLSRQIAEAARRHIAQHRSEADQDLIETLRAHVYLTVPDRIMHIASGELMRVEAFVRHYIDRFPNIMEALQQKDLLARVHNRTFAPGRGEILQENGAIYINDWRGLRPGCALPGDPRPWLDHIGRLVPDKDHRAHMLDWMAFTLQHPERKINHALVLTGRHGIGKDTLLWPLIWALDEHAAYVGPDAVASDFNAFYARRKLIVLEEADIGNRAQAHVIANRLKPVIACPPDTIRINPKGLPPYDIPNVVHLVLFSNHQRPVMLEPGDRRYFVVTARPPLEAWSDEIARGPEAQAYFRRLWLWMDRLGGREAVVHYLLTRDVSTFDPSAPAPDTEARRILIDQSLPPTAELIRDLLELEEGPVAEAMWAPDELTHWLRGPGANYLFASALRRPPGRHAILSAVRLLPQFLTARVRARIGHRRPTRLQVIVRPDLVHGRRRVGELERHAKEALSRRHVLLNGPEVMPADVELIDVILDPE